MRTDTHNDVGGHDPEGLPLASPRPPLDDGACRRASPAARGAEGDSLPSGPSSLPCPIDALARRHHGETLHPSL